MEDAAPRLRGLRAPRRALTRAAAAVGVAGALAALAGCAQDFSEAYAQRHPGFDAGKFPHDGAGLEETLAALRAPRHDAEDRTTLNDVRVFAIDGPVWSEVPLEAIEKGTHRTVGPRSWLVVTRVSCSMTYGWDHHWNESANWYLVLDDRLAAYRRAYYDRVCRGEPRRERYRHVQSAYLECIEDFAAATPGGPLDPEGGGCGAPPARR